MQVILLENIIKLGKIGDLVKDKNGILLSKPVIRSPGIFESEEDSGLNNNLIDSKQIETGFPKNRLIASALESQRVSL